MRNPRAILLVCLVGIFLAATRPVAGQVPAIDSHSTTEKPDQSETIPLFLRPPSTAEDFWKNFHHPDFVLLNGSSYQKLLEAAGKSGQAASPAPVVNSVTLGGRVVGESANLSLTVVLTRNAQEPGWASIGLDRLAALSRVRESGKEVLVRAGKSGDWEVELSGKGRHEVLVEASIRVSGTGDERKLVVPIPLSASTSLDLEVDRRVVDAKIGEREMAALLPERKGESTRVAARLSPRDKILLSWRVESTTIDHVPSLLTAEGELTVDVEPDLIRFRANWQISSARGTTRTLKIALDPADELLEVEVDGRPLTNETIRDPKNSKLLVNLIEPIRQGTSSRLKVSTRRKLIRGVLNRVNFGGFPLENAVIQAGAISVSRSRSVYVEGSIGRGLQRIDPRTELPNELRARPGTVLAYQFAEQPFALTLIVEPAPPRVRVEPKTTIHIEGDKATLDCWLEYGTSRGQVYDLSVVIPAGVELDGWGPEDIVDSAEYKRDETTANASSEPLERPRTLILHLTPTARDSGRFRVHLTGRQPLGTLNPARLQLFQPKGETPLGGLLAIIGDPGTEFGLIVPATKPPEPPFVKLVMAEPPKDWIWPSTMKTILASTATWLRQSGVADALPLAIVRQPRLLTQDTSLSVNFQRRVIEVEQETTVSIPFGSLRRLDVVIPAVLESTWAVEGPMLAGRDLLGTEPDGSRRYRLTFDRDLENNAKLRLRYQLPKQAAPDKGESGSVSIIPIRLIEPARGSMIVRAFANPGIDVNFKPVESGWQITKGFAPGGSDAAGRERFRLTRSVASAADPSIDFRVDPIVPMPELVASRLWLRSTQSANGEIDTSARYRVESHGPSIDVILPPDAKWVRAEINGETVREINALPSSGSFRLSTTGGLKSGPLTMVLDYRIASRTNGNGFSPPRLSEGLVQQTYWEARLPWNWLAIGVPKGWNDENVWQWDVYAWKRRPSLTSGELGLWLAGTPDRSRTNSEATVEPRADDHGYLFSRVGDPSPLTLSTQTKGVLLAACTGLVVLLGVTTVWLRVPTRFLLGGVVASVLGLLFVWDGEVAFTLIQSSTLGLFLTIAAAILQWVVDRRRGIRPVAVTPSGSTLSVGSANAPAAAVGSDESTAIRVRTGVEGDIIVIPPADSAISTAETPVAPVSAH